MKIDPQKSLILIDGSSFLYRAYYGLKPLHTDQGVSVQAVYGFCRMLQKLVQTFDPQHMVLVWDSPGKTTRHAIFSEYKATRQAPPSDLFDQKQLIIECADLINLAQVSRVGIEADDLIYSLALWWKQKHENVLLITSDKDMGQMLDEHTVMYDSFKDVFIDREACIEKMGFAVEKIPFYFALLGDASDNIPGVKGIGKTRALELVSRFDSLDDLYNNIDTITQKTIKHNLIIDKENAFLSQQLFMLQKYSIDLDYQEVNFSKHNWINAYPFFEKLGFKSFIKNNPVQRSIFATQQSTETISKKKYSFSTIITQTQLEAVIEKIKHVGMFAYDTECYGNHPLDMVLVGISLCYESGSAYYIPCNHVTEEVQLGLSDILPLLKDLFEDASIKKIAHHAKFDKHVLANAGINECGLFFDTMIASSLVKKEWQKNGLKELSEQYLHESMMSYEDTVTAHKRKNFAEVPLQEATEYAAADAHQTFRLYLLFKDMLQKGGFEELFYMIEMPLLEILFEMERRGIYCDVSVLKTLGIEVDKKLETLYHAIVSFVSEDKQAINLNSPRQIADLLFVDLQLQPQKKNLKNEGFSTDYAVLKELAKVHPVPAYLISYRELYKLKTTYIEALPLCINQSTGKIHTSYSQIRVVTGRLSSSDPNLQNIPNDMIGSQIRAAFKPQEEYLFLSADYSQIELRVLAYFSQDQKLLHLFAHDHDIHAETTAALLQIPIHEVTKEQRALGKRINFSILYGLTPYGLSKDLDISLSDAKKYIEGYFNQYPEVRLWMDRVIEETKQAGYVETFFKRRRSIPGIYERNKNLYEEACRIAINTKIQGTAAELMKVGMLRVDKALKKDHHDAEILLQIHDEILLSVAQKDILVVQKLVEKELSAVVSWNVLLKVESSSGTNWKEV